MKKIKFLFLGILSLGVLAICSIDVNAISVDSYYASVTATTGEALQKQLTSVISANTIDLGYDGLFDAYVTTDCKPGTNIIWDMYSNCEFNVYNDHSGNYSKEGDVYNREHSIPQSWFNERSPMKSDLFHVYPTDGYVNNRRSSYPFGEVGSATYTSKNGSKVGSSSFSGYSGTVFEPIDEYKGDFARTYFYMATRYANQVGSWTAGNATAVFKGSYPYLTDYAVNLFTKWAIEDPVSEKEINRNNAVYKLQNNRNPYIDHPEYVEVVFPSTYNQSGDVDEAKVNNVIVLINNLPSTITLEDKAKVNEAYVAYMTLSGQEKLLVTNYSILKAALDTIESLENNTGGSSSGGTVTVVDEINFALSNTGSYTKNYSFTAGDVKFVTNVAGVFESNVIRVGGNSGNKQMIPSEFKLDSYGGSIKMDTDVSNTSGVVFKWSEEKDISKWYIYLSTDSGVSWNAVASGDGGSASKEYRAELSRSYQKARYALVVTPTETGYARIYLKGMSLLAGSGEAIDLSKMTTNANLSINYAMEGNDIISVLATINIIGHFGSLIPDAKYGVIYGNANDISLKEYTGGTAIQYANSINAKVKEGTPSLVGADYRLKVNLEDTVLGVDYYCLIFVEYDGVLYLANPSTYKIEDMINYYIVEGLIEDDFEKLVLEQFIK